MSADANMDNEKLYSPSFWSDRNTSEAVKIHIDVVKEESEAVKKDDGVVSELDIRYGPGENQKIDIFESDKVNNDSPTLFYIHGGYWQDLNKDISAYCVRPMVRNGIRVVTVGYDLAPKVSVGEIVKEIRDLMTFLESLKEERNWKELWISGHSAGAHLAACVLCDESLSKNIAGFILFSGIYDLTPIIETSINHSLNLSKDTAADCSPLKMLSFKRNFFFLGCVIVVTAESDSPSFRNQALVLTKTLRSLSIETDFKLVPNVDHFTLVENLRDEQFPLTTFIINRLLSGKKTM